jgi:hypothetical protein
LQRGGCQFEPGRLHFSDNESRSCSGQRMQIGQLKTYLVQAVRSYFQEDLRWSQLAIAGLAVVGLAVNLLMPHGWTVWPLVLAAGLMIMINEAADRAGHGVPPLQVYSLFGAIVGAWIVVVLLLSTLNPLIFAAGILVLAYYAARGYLKNLAHQKLLEQRREEGLCVHCGAPANPEQSICDSCGEEANPDAARAKWSTLTGKSPQDKARIRAILKPPSGASEARSKEQALLNRRQRRGSAKK